MTRAHLLLDEIQTISESYERVIESTGENFNIFSILQMESDEVSVHSRFIAELLNNKGTHGLKNTFINSFIDFFSLKNELNTENYQVFIEYYIGKVEIDKGGRIDILIKDDLNNVIMIENKIYAPEQPNQLLRYHNAFPKGKLFYLTLYGDQSKKSSSEAISYECISYENDIVSWLEICKKDAVNLPILRETISQYINLIKKLTNQNINKQMSEDVISRILRNENSLLAYKALFEVHKDLKTKIVQDIVNDIKDRLNKKAYTSIETISTNKDKGILIALTTETLKEMGMKLALNFESPNYSNLIIGFINLENDKKHNQILLEKFQKQYPKAKQSNWWRAYMFYEKYRNWNFSTLTQIYFNKDSFYEDLEHKITFLLSLVEKPKTSIKI